MDDGTPPPDTPPPARSGAGEMIARRPKKVERSCILCHRRKIRCDKRSPCSTCTRAGLLCCYPPAAEQLARRPRKTTIADVAERLVRLERTLVAISSSDQQTDAGPQMPGSAQVPPLVGGEVAGIGAGKSVMEEFLVQSGDSSRYINEILISRVLEEEEELRSVLGSQETAKQDDVEPNGDRLPPLDAVGLLSGHGPPSVDSRDLHPTKWQAMQLWQVFVNNVDFFNKVLHIPTTQVVIYNAIEHPPSAPADVACLLFSVYFAAVTASENGAVIRMLGHGKPRALDIFRRGLELSLARADFLETPTLLSMQAMGIFLQSIRAHDTGKSVWVLNGLVLRAAQSMGLHRDGKVLGLSVFETEMRRRLWWLISTNDGRVAEDHSITINAFDPEMNIQFPSNVNDGEIYPGMTALPETRGRWTDMSLSLVMKEYGVAQRRVYQVMPPHSTSVPSEAVRREIVDKALATCEEEYFRYCNPVIPLQRASMLMGRAVLAKLAFVSRLQWLSISNQNTTRGLLSTDETLAEACQVLEYGTQIQADDLLRNYRWIVEVYPQYHVLLYVLWRLCVKPTGPSVDRAWAQVDRSFDVEFGRLGFENARAGSKWTLLKAFREKASRIRHRVADGKATGSGPATYSEVPENTATAESGTPDGLGKQELGGGYSWDPEDGGLPDWNELMDADLNFEAFDIPI